MRNYQLYIGTTKPFENVIMVVERERAVIKLLRGNILDIGDSVKIPDKKKPVDFHKVREEVKIKIAKRVATSK